MLQGVPRLDRHDAADDLLKEGESVICSAKKNKQFYDGQTATIIKFLQQNRVKIKMTSGAKQKRSSYSGRGEYPKE